MVSNEEIRIMLECKRKGLDPDKVLQKIQIPYGWVGDSCVFDFDSMSTEDLFDRINKLFEDRRYYLEDETSSHCIYIKGWYTYEVKIYSNKGKTYLDISNPVGLIDKIFARGSNPKLELDRLINKIKYLKQSFDGYLVCDKCNEYYKLQLGESLDDFIDKCECGGHLKYYDNIGWLLKENND